MSSNVCSNKRTEGGVRFGEEAVLAGGAGRGGRVVGERLPQHEGLGVLTNGLTLRLLHLLAELSEGEMHVTQFNRLTLPLLVDDPRVL